MRKLTKEEFDLFSYIDVNGELCPIPEDCALEKCFSDPYGIALFEQRYGMGSVAWPLISGPETHKTQMEYYWRCWAADRIKWLMKRDDINDIQNEVDEAVRVLMTGVR